METKKIIKYIKIIIICCCIICGIGYVIITRNNPNEVKKVLEEVPIYISEEKVSDEKTERMLKIEELQKQNPDIVGWIEINGTIINYPVLQSKDNNYYMKKNYLKEYDYNGSIFLDKGYDWNLPSSNLLIYGHNNLNGTMFQELLNYKDENYYKEHQKIRFTTNAEDVEYEIISVFYSRVYYKSEKDVFRYYYFVNAKNENEFNDYVKNSLDSSIYNTGKTAKYGEQLMTLSTCSYHTEDGRFVVVAKKVSKEEKRF